MNISYDKCGMVFFLTSFILVAGSQRMTILAPNDILAAISSQGIAG